MSLLANFAVSDHSPKKLRQVFQPAFLTNGCNGVGEPSLRTMQVMICNCRFGSDAINFIVVWRRRKRHTVAERPNCSDSILESTLLGAKQRPTDLEDWHWFVVSILEQLQDVVRNGLWSHHIDDVLLQVQSVCVIHRCVGHTQRTAFLGGQRRVEKNCRLISFRLSPATMNIIPLNHDIFAAWRT